jgi:putative endonuclease
MSEHIELGKMGEAAAASFLKKRGYNIIKQNWIFQKAELDIIAEKNNKIIVTEVKTRGEDHLIDPIRAITMKKQKQMVKAANAYITENDLHSEVRFDVITVVFNRNKPEIEHIEDAFYASI